MTEIARQLKIEQALYEIADAASAVTDLPSFYKRLHEIVGTLMYAGNFFIATYDEQTGLISWPYQVDEVEPPYPPAPLADFRGLTSWVLRTGQVAGHGWDLSNELLARGEICFPDVGTANEDGIGVPLKADGKTIGVVMVQSYTKGVEYTDQDEQVLEFVAQHIAVALTRARAMEETRQRDYELQIINSVQEGLASQLDIHAIFDLVGDMICEIFKSDSAGIFTYDRETNLEYFPYLMQRGYRLFQEPLPLDEKGFSPLVMHTRQPIMINEHLAERAAEVGAFLLGGAEMQGSCIYVPLVLGEEARGVIVISADREHAFTDSDLRLLSTLANSMSVALENARLFEETQRLFKETEDRAAELQIINSVQEGLASKLEMQGIYDLVGDKIREIFDANTVTLATFDFEKNLMYPHYAFEKGQRFFIEPLPVPEVYGEFIQRAQPLLINRNLDEYVRRLDPGARPLAGEMPKSVLAVPLIMNGILSGIITLQNIDRENAFGESDLRLLQTLANSMSVALENALLFEETQQRNAELAIINSVQEGLASKLEMQEIYELVGEKLREVFQQADLSISVYDPETDLLSVPFCVERGQRIPFPAIKLNGRGIIVHMLADPKSMFFDKEDEMVRAFAEYQSADITGGGVPKSALYVPLMTLAPGARAGVGGSMRGAVVLEDLQNEHAFKESDVRLLETLTDSMSVALENARLWEQEKMYRKALERELEIGREIQAGFLPEELPSIQGWEIAASLMSAREVAGDFYDAFELPDGKIGIVIADVCDKGVGAALFMTLFRSLIRAVSNLDYFENFQASLPHSAVERLQRAVLLTNNYIAETHGKSGMFATLFFGILDPGTGRLIYINGGHELPFILRCGNVYETLRKTGPAVGIFTNPSFQISETQLQAGDIFFAFTDGVPDCQNPQGEFFGRERLFRVFQKEYSSAHQLVKATETELHQFINGGTQFDDITLLAVKRG